MLSVEMCEVPRHPSCFWQNFKYRCLANEVLIYITITAHG